MLVSKVLAAVLVASTLVASTLTAAVRVGTFKTEVRTFYSTADGLPSNDVRHILLRNGEVVAETSLGWSRLAGTKWLPESAQEIPKVISPQLFPREGNRSWAPVDVRAVIFDSRGRLWFASPQGVGSCEKKCIDGKWKLYTSAEGLPYDDFTTMAAGEDGVVWFGTHRGAIRFDGTNWEYRQGLRWLPNDDIRGIAVDSNGDAWFATAKGVGLIARRPKTLPEMAKFFEDEIDQRHRRTPYGYVDSVSLPSPGDKSNWNQHDSDNDGLWTGMYGAGECFAYSATHDPQAKKRAQAAFEALRFLGQVTQGGSNPAPKGFVARSILPTNGRNPNLNDSPEHDRQNQATRDKLWKVIVPRWPTSADGQWYWKSDTSSDELDGHYFFYANYFDLVAETQDEKQRVRDHVAAITDHLIEHGFQYVDHDGKVARWGVFNPEQLNSYGSWWEDRALNSLSMLSYLRTAEHITGNPKYGAAARELIEKHGYAANVVISKTNAGPGSGNQSDDEMAFMNFYCLLKYEKDPQLRQLFGLAFHHRWTMEKFELNPLFNFLYAASVPGLKFEDAFAPQDLSPKGAWLDESVDTLKRYPLDRLNWALNNSHRKDIVLLPEYVRGSDRRGSRRDGRVLPIDERYVDKWNHDPWALDSRGDGRRLADGASFLLPYYLGLYLKFIEN